MVPMDSLRADTTSIPTLVPAPHHWYQKGLDPGVDLDLINPRTWPIYQKEIVSKLIQDRQVIILTYITQSEF